METSKIAFDSVFVSSPTSRDVAWRGERNPDRRPCIASGGRAACGAGCRRRHGRAAMPRATVARRRFGDDESARTGRRRCGAPEFAAMIESIILRSASAGAAPWRPNRAAWPPRSACARLGDSQRIVVRDDRLDGCGLPRAARLAGVGTAGAPPDCVGVTGADGAIVVLPAARGAAAESGFGVDRGCVSRSVQRADDRQGRGTREQDRGRLPARLFFDAAALRRDAERHRHRVELVQDLVGGLWTRGGILGETAHDQARTASEEFRPRLRGAALGRA